jgi:hypothetical protein
VLSGAEAGPEAHQAQLHGAMNFAALGEGEPPHTMDRPICRPIRYRRPFRHKRFERHLVGWMWPQLRPLARLDMAARSAKQRRRPLRRRSAAASQPPTSCRHPIRPRAQMTGSAAYQPSAVHARSLVAAPLWG